MILFQLGSIKILDAVQIERNDVLISVYQRPDSAAVDRAEVVMDGLRFPEIFGETFEASGGPFEIFQRNESNVT